MISQIPISDIESSGMFSDRTSDVEDLLNSLSREGQLSPIRVREHPTKKVKFEVVFGNRRLSAARKLGWKTVDAEVVRATDEETLVMAFSENVDRKDFTDYEKARMLQKLHLVSGKSYAEIASHIGKSPAFVSQHIAMLHLFPDSVGSERERSKVLHSLSENHTRILARINDNNERWNTAKLVVSANLSVRELQKLCGKVTKKELEGTHEAAKQDSLDCSKVIRQIVSSITSAPNSKDIRPIFETASKRHFTMFPGISPLPSVVDRKGIENYLFQVLRRMTNIKIDSPNFVDLRYSGNMAYVAIMLKEEISTQKKSVQTVCRATMILERERTAGWKVVHSHWSYASPLEIEGISVAK
jgi:ParB/RepB/Spo0J family partition protein